MIIGAPEVRETDPQKEFQKDFGFIFFWPCQFYSDTKGPALPNIKEGM